MSNDHVACPIAAILANVMAGVRTAQRKVERTKEPRFVADGQGNVNRNIRGVVVTFAKCFSEDYAKWAAAALNAYEPEEGGPK